ncbi:MAG: ribonuclease P protein component [Gammaproteobacteria bacterium]|nr:MAG: ribonuclease P protein component [Gammaproteobacteria bacterium]
MATRQARLSHHARLKRPEEYHRVFSGNPVKIQSKALTLLALPNVLGQPRLGIAVPKKHVPLSVQRNRLKRLVRESFRAHQNKLMPLDIVIMARSNVAELSNREIVNRLNEQMDALVKKCGIS